MKSQQIMKLKQILKKHLKNNITYILLIGSSIKNKSEPNDIDLIVLFKEKYLKQVEENLFEIREDLDFLKSVHIEPLFVDSMFEESIFLTSLHEGFSVKYWKSIIDVLGLKSYVIFMYNLENLSKLDKVRFAQALYGRKKDGILFQEKGVSLGFGSFMVDVKREEIFKEFFSKWKVKFLKKKAFVSD